MTLVTDTDLEILIADPDKDLDDVRCVLDSAARWLASQGIEQWPLSFLEDGGRRMRALAAQAENGNVYLVRALHQPIGTFTLTPWQDPDFASGWPPVDESKVQYVMRLAATRAARAILGPDRPALGGWMLNTAAVGLAADRGANHLRLDCSRTNTRLHAYYESHGFERVGTMTVAGRKSGALFQKMV